MVGKWETEIVEDKATAERGERDLCKGGIEDTRWMRKGDTNSTAKGPGAVSPRGEADVIFRGTRASGVTSTSF